MKVLDITINDDGESVNVMTYFTANELQTLLQFGINMSASIGLTARKVDQEQEADEAPHQLND